MSTSPFPINVSVAFDQAALSFMETELKTIELHIAMKKSELAFPTPTTKRTLTNRGGLPRILFMSMQRDLNRSFSTNEVQRYRDFTQEEIITLVNKRDRLEVQRYRDFTQEEIITLVNKRDRLAENINKLKTQRKWDEKEISAAKELTNGHVHEPAKIVLFTKREKVG